MLNIIQPVGEAPPPEELERIMAELRELRRDLELSEHWIFGAGLEQPRESTVVRMRDDECVARDGPYTEADECVGGFAAIEAEDRDGALQVAARYAQITGLPIEVRPISTPR
ncbi:YciI family protein [Actinomadura sp. LOL_016]|uniref:YciI family protein n=1 Tax=unclassified Actinomadura TaxID=2626254 RepID=UPI003A7F7E46